MIRTTSLQLSKQLQGAGILIESNDYRWIRTENTWFVDPVMATPDGLINHGEWYPAYTTDELLEWLPDIEKTTVILEKTTGVSEDSKVEYDAYYEKASDLMIYRDSMFTASTPADALAKLALWVKSQERK